MEIILNETVPSLGFVGDIVKVTDGYARNYLFPRALALEANPRNRKAVEHRKRLMEVKRSALLAEAQAYKGKLEAVTVTVSKQVGAEGKLFGSVTTVDITDFLHNQGITIDRKLIGLAEPIKTLGTHKASVKLHPEVTASITIEVSKLEE